MPLLLTLEPRGLVVLLMLVAHATCVTNNGRCGMTSVSGLMQNCVPGSNDVIQIIPSYNINMHNCIMSTQASVNITKEIKTATMHYSCSLSAGTKMAGTVDFCAPEKKLPKQVVDAMTSFNIPSKCPMQATVIDPTENSKVNMTNFKSALPLMMGSSSCTLNIEADSGKSCLKGTVVIKTLNRMIG